MGRPSIFEKHNKVFVFFLPAFELTSFCHPVVRESHAGHFVLCVCLESVPTYKCAIVSVLRSLSAGKSSSLRCLTEGEPFLSHSSHLYSVLMRICSQTHSHMAGSDFNHWLRRCIYSHLKVLQILQHATLMCFTTWEKLESVYFIIKGKGSVFFWKIWETCLGIKKQSNFLLLYKGIVIPFTVNALTESKALLKMIK